MFDGYAAQKWVKGGLRSNNLEPNARLCMASAVSGFLTQFQSDEPMGCYQDLELGDDFVLWGNNMAEMHPVLFSRILETKRQKPGTRLVDIATRRTPTTDYADLHVLFKPGTDLALANGILHLLLSRGSHSAGVLDENVVFPPRHRRRSARSAMAATTSRPSVHLRGPTAPRTIDELRTLLNDFAPDRVSEITGVSVNRSGRWQPLWRPVPRHREPVGMWRESARTRPWNEQSHHGPASHYGRYLPNGARTR